MKAFEAIKILVGYSEKELRAAIAASPDRGLNVDGMDVHPLNEMPAVDNGLMRIGRHSWMIWWDGDSGRVNKLTVDE